MAFGFAGERIHGTNISVQLPNLYLRTLGKHALSKELLPRHRTAFLQVQAYGGQRQHTPTAPVADNADKTPAAPNILNMGVVL